MYFAFKALSLPWRFRLIGNIISCGTRLYLCAPRSKRLCGAFYGLLMFGDLVVAQRPSGRTSSIDLECCNFDRSSDAARICVYYMLNCPCG